MAAENPAVAINVTKLSPTSSNENTLHKAQKMENAREDDVSEGTKVEINGEAGVKEESEAGKEPDTPPETPDATQTQTKKAKKHIKCRRRNSHKKSAKAEKKKKSKKVVEDSSDDSDSDSDASTESETSSDDESTDSSSEDEKRKRKRKAKKKAKAKKDKKKAKRRSKKYDSSSDDSESDSDEDSESEEEQPKRKSSKKSKKAKKSRKTEEESDSDEESEDDDNEDDATSNTTKLQAQMEALKLQLALQKRAQAEDDGKKSKKAKRKGRKDKDERGKKKKGKRASTLEFKRVDQLWDSTIHNYKLTETAEEKEDEFDEYVFTVRRKFDWENKYRHTVVDIKSKLLREALAEVMKEVKSVSLVEEQPCIDPNMLFLYLEEIRTHYKKTLKARLKKERKRKEKKRLKLIIAQCKVLVGYIDEDYDETKKTLYPLLEAGNITFDLLWALFKPNTIAYTATYGSADDPRCYKVDYANKESSFVRGEWYCIEGRYLEYDGKSFGLGDFEVNVDAFKGPRKITSLATYPLKFHKDPEGLKKELIERGKRFVMMQGMNYRFHKGLAFQKKKKAVAKVNINGRIMVDPAIFRRINPNYPISIIKPKGQDDMYSDDEDSDCSDCCCSSSDEEENSRDRGIDGEKDDGKERTMLKVYFDKDDKPHIIEVPVDENGRELQTENLDKVEGNNSKEPQSFTDEELLIASPVVLGFAFSEKLWLEFSLSGVRDIEWNEGAFESLVLPANQKSIVKALVSSHKFHAAETIDDVVQGKGKGLVFVLHGPPGVGKTLTGEGIAEFLKCPLYAVSAGELGTDSRMLEHELQKIMDIAHSWGAVLLLDEADVFLEKREVHDIHRNALVSIFLRLLEYFQGILFLTTNRVETFDDAFQSRIHVALRYDALGNKAKKEIWKMFLEKVRVMEGIDVMPFKESDYDHLARNELNGRQIKNAVRTAQALAVNEGARLSAEHIKRVLEVAESFERDLKGGTGYLDAMRSYT